MFSASNLISLITSDRLTMNSNYIINYASGFGKRGVCTSVEDPLNRPASEDILVVPNEIDLLPHIAEEIINFLLTQIRCTLEPIGAENTHFYLHDLAGGVGGIKRVEEGGAVVPLEVVGYNVVQLILNDVEVAAVGPVVPQVEFLERSGSVHEHQRVELVRPICGNWVLCCSL